MQPVAKQFVLPLKGVKRVEKSVDQQPLVQIGAWQANPADMLNRVDQPMLAHSLQHIVAVDVNLGLANTAESHIMTQIMALTWNLLR